MDGVIIDSNPYHKIAWTNFLNRKNIVVNDSIFKELIFGTDAGLIVIGVTTSYKNNELIDAGATICVKDFFEISLENIHKLIENTLRDRHS